MAKVIKISDRQAFRIEAIETESGVKFLSIRKMYSTKSDPEFKPTRQGITLPYDEAIRILRAGANILKDENTTFTKVSFNKED